MKNMLRREYSETGYKIPTNYSTISQKKGIKEVFEERKVKQEMKVKYILKSTHELKNVLIVITNTLELLNFNKLLEAFNNIDEINTLKDACEFGKFLLNDIQSSKYINYHDQIVNTKTDERFYLIDVLDFCSRIFKFMTGLSEKDNSKDETVEYIPDYKSIKNSYSISCISQNRLKQVILNLLSNAKKFTLKGEIRLQCKVIDNIIRFNVIDTGMGMPKNKAKNIFNPDRFLEQSKILNNNMGSGVGLFVVYDILNAFHIDINCESEIEKGTVFTFDIPYTDDTLKSSNNQTTYYNQPNDENDIIDFDKLSSDKFKHEIMKINAGMKESKRHSVPHNNININNMIHNLPNITLQNPIKPIKFEDIEKSLIKSKSNKNTRFKNKYNQETNDDNNDYQDHRSLTYNINYIKNHNVNNYYYYIIKDMYGHINISDNNTTNMHKYAKSKIKKDEISEMIETTNNTANNKSIFSKFKTNNNQQTHLSTTYKVNTKKYDTCNSNFTKISTSNVNAIQLNKSINNSKSLEIFVCDDDNIARKSIYKLFEKVKNETNYKINASFFSHEVTFLTAIFKNYEEKKNTHIVLIDLNLQNMSGNEIILFLKHLRIFSGTKFILLSASNIEQEESCYNDIGYDQFYVKPLKFEVIIDIIKNYQ